MEAERLIDEGKTIIGGPPCFRSQTRGTFKAPFNALNHATSGKPFFLRGVYQLGSWG